MLYMGVQDSYNTLISPSACLLRFLKLPEDQQKLISLKDVAVIVMAYLEQMAENYVCTHGLYKVSSDGVLEELVIQLTAM